MKYFSVLICVPLRVLLLSAILSGVCLSRLRKRLVASEGQGGRRAASCTPWPKGDCLLLARAPFWNQIYCIHSNIYGERWTKCYCEVFRQQEARPQRRPRHARSSGNLPLRVMHSKSTFILAVRHKGASVYLCCKLW